MAYTYMQAIGTGFPGVECHAIGDGSVYENIVWDAGVALPSKATLDTWIAANPNGLGIVITKYDFRKLFTLAERVAIDNVKDNTVIPAQYKAMIVTMYQDLDASTEVQFYNPDVIAGVGLLEAVGLIAPGRGAQIMSNTPPV
jgi:hypothetical protein